LRIEGGVGCTERGCAGADTCQGRPQYDQRREAVAGILSPVVSGSSAMNVPVRPLRSQIARRLDPASGNMARDADLGPL